MRAACRAGYGRLLCVLLSGQRGAGLSEKVALARPVLADEPDDEVLTPAAAYSASRSAVRLALSVTWSAGPSFRCRRRHL